MQERKFYLYDKASAQSVFTAPCTLIKLDGNYSGGGAEYLQIFDKATAAVANDVPIASFVLGGAGPLPSIFETMGAVPLLLGLSIGISTVNEKYTASASAFDIFGGIEEQELPVQELTSSTTANTSGVQLWSEAAGPKTLYSLNITNGTGLAAWVMIFAHNTVVDGNTPRYVIPISNSSAIQPISFGAGGLQPRELLESLLKQGCSVYISTTGNVLTQTAATNVITANYK